MPTPRRESSTGPTTASSYILECKMLRAYGRLCDEALLGQHRPHDKQATCVRLLGGNLAATQVRGAEKRVREALPEIIQKLTAQQQPGVAELLLTESPCLVTVIRELVRLERNINYRDEDPRLSINDDGRLKAAGMGHLSKAIYGNLPKLGPPLELTPWVPRLRTAKRRALKRHVHRTRKYVGYPQLSLGFPGGEVTLASVI
jgi:hypothetical protein